MSLVTFTPAAAADLDNIWDYTVKEWGADGPAEEGPKRSCFQLP